MKIPLNQPYLPSYEKYANYLGKMYENKWLTNNGPLLREFVERLKEHLGVRFVIPTSSGTAALQLAYRLFGIEGNIITTPYSFVATCNSADWIGLGLKFADIDPHSLNISPVSIKKLIDDRTSAIVPVHAYGNPCDVDNIEKIAKKHNLKVIYDAAHAFGIKQMGQSLLNRGDASAISLHTTKVFHCIEGGALILKDQELYEKAMNMINFGIDSRNGNIIDTGFNGKMSEAHAAMGLAMLDDIDMVIEKRLEHFKLYRSILANVVQYPSWDTLTNQNAAYFPILLSDRAERNKVSETLMRRGIQSRPYFSPSLNTIDQFNKGVDMVCPVSEQMVDRVLCLPMFYALTPAQIKRVCATVISVLREPKSAYLRAIS